MSIELPQDLKQCIEFHGHLCPGLTYGYRVAKEAIRLLGLKRSEDEEVVAIPENDSCAVDALQILLGTTAGKGNLILRDYGKNVYTILDRSSQRAVRFSRISRCQAQTQDKIKKANELLSKPFEEIFVTQEIKFSMPPYAPLAPSEPCIRCSEMTMSSKMKSDSNGKLLCIPCAAIV